MLLCRYSPNCQLDFPKGGSQAIIAALVRQAPLFCTRSAIALLPHACRLCWPPRLLAVSCRQLTRTMLTLVLAMQGPEEARRQDPAQGTHGRD